MVSLLRYIAWAALLGGFVLGFVYGIKVNILAPGYHQTEFSILTALVWWVSGIVASLLFYTLSYAIAVIEDIQNKLEQLLPKSSGQRAYPETGKSKSTADVLEPSDDFKLPPINKNL